MKVATNAGGVNPSGCKRALEDVIGELGLSLTVAMVEGDDVMPLIEGLRANDLREAVSGKRLPARLLTANAYLGALPIKAAFDGGADIVITGRCADSALALGVLMHEFHWAVDDYDRLGGAVRSAIYWNADRKRRAGIQRLGEGAQLAQYWISNRGMSHRRKLCGFQARPHGGSGCACGDCRTDTVRAR